MHFSCMLCLGHVTAGLCRANTEALSFVIVAFVCLHGIELAMRDLGCHDRFSRCAYAGLCPFAWFHRLWCSFSYNCLLLRIAASGGRRNSPGMPGYRFHQPQRRAAGICRGRGG